MTDAPVHYAIGDIHGRDDLLEIMHGRIAADFAARHAGRRGVIVYMGDYVDRGPQSKQVIDRVRAGLPGFETVCLKGNHEDMMMSYLETGDLAQGGQWMMNGGRETMASYGVRHLAGLPEAARLRDAVGAEHLSWLRALQLYHQTERYLFVHAGIMPGRPLAEQQADAFLWIRTAFLGSNADHGRRVIHGHTPVREPDVRPNRINIDTGAVWTGRLTCAVLDGTEGAGAPRFLTAEGPRLDDLRVR